MLGKMNDLMGGYTVIVTTKQVQRRRHKKKRINKKWIKRYGYITKDWQKRGETVVDQVHMTMYMNQATYNDLIIALKNSKKKEDRPMPRQKKEGKKNIRKDISMDPEQYERLIDYCRQQDRPISWVIRQELEIYLHV